MQISPVTNRTRNIDDYRRNLNLLKKNLDVPPGKFKFNETKELYKEFWEGHMENLTRSKLAKWELYNTNSVDYTLALQRNFNKLNEIPEIKELRAKAIEKTQTLYPKTATLREILAQEGRVVFDKVTPKLTGFKKLLLKMKMFV